MFWLTNIFLTELIIGDIIIFSFGQDVIVYKYKERKYFLIYLLYNLSHAIIGNVHTDRLQLIYIDSDLQKLGSTVKIHRLLYFIFMYFNIFVFLSFSFKLIKSYAIDIWSRRQKHVKYSMGNTFTVCCVN